MVTLQTVADTLRASTNASRVTVRAPRHPGEPGTTLLAESLAPGVASMADAPQTGIAAAPTYTYLRTKRVPLLQDDCREDPLPPAMLTDTFHVGAQMLGPLLAGDDLIGTVSVHEVGRTRHWTEADLATLETAVVAVEGLIGLR
ncbi:MAG: hypothetical protein JWP75_3853 [Frondihabitans sp.]|nr:hypothetical protein [Frondihabitans sp.]